MNICVIGGGEPGKFGNDFCNLAKAGGHSVYIISHKDYSTTDTNHISANFDLIDNVVSAFEKITSRIEQLDILLYNVGGGGTGPCRPEDFKSTSSLTSIDQWMPCIKQNVIIPYTLAISALKKMAPGGKIVFMTTGWSLTLNRPDSTEFAGYAGSKAFQNYIMLGLANYNDKDVIVSSISPALTYDNLERYQSVLNKIYAHIMNITTEHNGKVAEIYN